MCAACVAQGAVYVGGALAGLQVLSARAKARRHADEREQAVERRRDHDEGRRVAETR